MILKKLKIAIIAVFLSAFYSCGENMIDKNDIIGKWKVHDYKTDLKKEFDLSPAIIQGAKEIALSAFYEFKKDSTYTFRSSMENYQGTWTLKKKDLEMKFTSEYEKNGIEKCEVIKLNDGNMIWEVKFAYGNTKTILRKD